MIKHVLANLLMLSLATGSTAQMTRLIPDFATAQYAGSIGFASIGVGYDVKARSRISLHYGYVPASLGGTLNIVAGKYAFVPMQLERSARLTIQPVAIGAMLTYHFGENFYSKWPSHRYPEGYYWWKSSLRFHVLAESSFTYTLSNSFFKTVSGYLEFNTNDLYAVSYALNTSGIHFFDIIKLGAGIRVRF